MKDSLFNIDFKRLAFWFLPTFRRKPVNVQFLFCLLGPVETMYVQLLKDRKQNLIRMNYNYQKFSLEKRLNEVFDPVEKRIRLIKAVQYEGVYLFTEAEDDQYHSKTKYLYDDSHPVYLRTESELYSEYDFTVMIPNTAINIMQLRAEIDFYKLISKRYQIKYI